jgi:hypothetical protein
MTIGAITVGAKSGHTNRPVFVDSIGFLGDDAYPTGGTALLAAVQAKTLDQRDIVGVVAGDCGGYVPVYDQASGKLKVYTSNGAAPAALAEVPNATDLSATTFNLVVLSR